jgi:hypothetical protein
MLWLLWLICRVWYSPHAKTNTKESKDNSSKDEDSGDRHGWLTFALIVTSIEQISFDFNQR